MEIKVERCEAQVAGAGRSVRICQCRKKWAVTHKGRKLCRQHAIAEGWGVEKRDSDEPLLVFYYEDGGVVSDTRLCCAEVTHEANLTYKITTVFHWPYASYASRLKKEQVLFRMTDKKKAKQILEEAEALREKQNKRRQAIRKRYRKALTALVERNR